MKESLLYKVLRPFITFFVKIVYKPNIIGAKNIPKSGSFVLAGNHTSYLDCILLISCIKRPIHFMAKIELSKGLLSPLFKNMGLIFVDRKTKNKKALETANDCLVNNMIVLIFPEGTINRTNDVIMPFKYGAVSLASKSNCNIVPFVIKGEYKMFKRSITIIFEKPYKTSDTLEIENKKLENIIRSELINKELK